MTDYLSPERLRLKHLGMDFSMPLVELAEVLAQAQDTVDAYCNMPLDPPGSSFLGGTAVERHSWPFPDSVLGQGKRRLYPFHWPVKTATSLRVVVGQDAAAVIPEDSLVINNTERWIEVTALSIASNSGLFTPNGWLVPIGGLQVPMAELTIEYGWDIAETDDRCFAIDNTNLVFSASHEHWINDDTDPAVSVDGALASPQPTIDYLLGRMTFTGAQTGRVTATYRHKLPRAIPSAEGLIAAYALGASKLREKDMEGLESVKDDSITITRRRPMPKADNLEATVPEAALLLGGYKHWRMG